MKTLDRTMRDVIANEIMEFLDEAGSATLTELAERLRRPRECVAQAARCLAKDGCLRVKKGAFETVVERGSSRKNGSYDY